MENGRSDDARARGIILGAAAGAIERLSAATRRIAVEPGARLKDDDALTRRVLKAIATSETIRSNCRAANTRLSDIDEAEEAAMLARAQRMLARVLESKRSRPPPSAPN